ncbi:MAG TPA: hypothetical protein VG738_24215 [Chitinophagaceae bacterium]|nr:hypothetical protein [Chitinophagaceae bacterium]
MNIFNKVLLKMVLLPSSLYKRMGVNIHQLKAILTTKLIMDDRRPNSFQQMRQKARRKPVSTATLSTMFMAVVVGCLFTYMSFILTDTITRFTIYFSFFIAFLASVLIADFTSVLIDVRDTYIILPKPVTDKTFVLSRLLHIFIHVCKIVIPMILPGAIFFGSHYNIVVLIAFLFMVIMATLFTLFLINACYILILKISTPQKFQNVISYVQIAFAIFFYACYQLVPRMMNKFAGFNINHIKFIWLLPPYWFAGTIQQVYEPVNTVQLWLCVVLSVAAPVFCLWLVIKYFAPSFNKKLSLISAGVSENADKTTVKQEVTATTYSMFLAKLFTKKGTERTGFLFTWKMMLRSREFKMKVYPSIGYMLVIIVLMFFNMKGLSFGDIRLQNSKGRVATLIVIYFSNLLLIGALGQITMYDKFKAAWIFFTTPVDVPGKIVSGAVKASIAQFFFPIVLITFVCLVSIAGIRIIPNVLFGYCNVLLVSAVSAYLTTNKLPFSSAPTIRGSVGMLRLFTVMILGTLMAFAHYSLYNITAVIIILVFISGGAAWMIFDSIKKYSWQKISSNYED